MAPIILSAYLCTFLGRSLSRFSYFILLFPGESVEENANLVIRLLIRRPECLGPALRGEGEGLLAAVISGNAMSEQIRQLVDGGRADGGHPLPQSDDDEDWIDTGAAILSFYCTLVDLLGRSAFESSHKTYLRATRPTVCFQVCTRSFCNSSG